MAGRPPGSPNKDKPFRDAIRMEAALAEQGQETPAFPGSLRWIARQLLIRAGEETNATKEVGDRMDGKVPQAVENGEDGPFQLAHTIERLIVDPNKDS
jgi:hypothetical protein